MIVRKQFDPPWKKKDKGKSSFDDAFIHLGLNGEFQNAREIKEPVAQPTPKR